ncbi:hypothetical protein ACP4OV_026941 [Aristida adscensionis]
MGQARAQLLASLVALYLVLAFPHVDAGIADYIDIMWGNAKYVTDSSGQQAVAMTLDRYTSSAFRSKSTYRFCRIDVDIKLVPGDSAGTVTTFYMISEGQWQIHDEIDLEFLGNSTGEPYTLHTNMYAKGKGGREKQYRLWFDPTQDYHTYTIIWNRDWTLILVDNKLLRQIKNKMSNGVAYPYYQPMRVYATIWNADDWATQGGQVKTDWTQAPFVAYFKNYKAIDCSYGNSPMCGEGSTNPGGWLNQELDDTRKQQLKEVDSQNKIYDYCTDTKRYKYGFPAECMAES